MGDLGCQLPLLLPRTLRQRVDDALARLDDSAVLYRDRLEVVTGADVRRILRAHIDAGLLGYTGTHEHVARLLRWAEGAAR